MPPACLSPRRKIISAPTAGACRELLPVLGCPYQSLKAPVQKQSHTRTHGLAHTPHIEALHLRRMKVASHYGCPIISCGIM